MLCRTNRKAQSSACGREREKKIVLQIFGVLVDGEEGAPDEVWYARERLARAPLIRLVHFWCAKCIADHDNRLRCMLFWVLEYLVLIKEHASKLCSYQKNGVGDMAYVCCSLVRNKSLLASEQRCVLL